jgi:hypothetical protein
MDASLEESARMSGASERHTLQYITVPLGEQAAGDQRRHAIWWLAGARSARWVKATQEVSLAVLESSRTRREVLLSHQIPTND